VDKAEWQFLLKQARAGDAQAQSEVAMYYEDGDRDEAGAVVVRREPRRALLWYRKAAEQGDRMAQGQLGRLLSSEEATPDDLEEAMDWCRKAVEAGEATAAHTLGCIYRDLGKHREAYRWYERSHSLGDLESLLEIGLSLLFGIGVRKDESAAFDAFRMLSRRKPCCDASERGIEDAHYWMGVCYLSGSGVRRSLAKARECLEIADRDGDHEAAGVLLWITGRSTEA
jgi:uncharacterized protein